MPTRTLSDMMGFLRWLLDMATGGPLADAIADAARRHWAPERVPPEPSRGR